MQGWGVLLGPEAPGEYDGMVSRGGGGTAGRQLDYCRIRRRRRAACACLFQILSLGPFLRSLRFRAPRQKSTDARVERAVLTRFLHSKDEENE